jgi:hypothetical protein
MKYLLSLLMLFYLPAAQAGGSGSLMTNGELNGNILTFKEIVNPSKEWALVYPDCKNKIITLQINSSIFYVLKNKLLGRRDSFSDLDEIEHAFFELKKLKSNDKFSFSTIGSSVKKIKDCTYSTHYLRATVNRTGTLSLESDVPY